ncbi:MAG: long-chain fatty acid--CoA ligase [Promethearchaeota archaeon]
MELPDYIKNRIWKDYLPDGMTVDIEIPENMTLIDIFKNGAEKFGDKVSKVYFGRPSTFNEMDILVRRFISSLLDLGIKKGDVVALWLPNCPQFIISYFATICTGATLTAISPLFVAREMAYQIKDSGAKYLIMLDRFFPYYQQAKEDLSLNNTILVNAEGKTPEQEEKDEIIHFNTLMAKYPEPILEIGDLDININPKEDIAVIQYTGGTTGLPKGACLSHYNIISNVLQMKQISDHMKETYLKDDIKAVSVLPWYHIYGQTCELAINPINGSMGYILPTFDIPTIVELVKEKKVNTLLGVPTMFLGLLAHPMTKDVDFSCLKYTNVGAGALSAEHFNLWKQKTGFAMGEGYGLSEASPTVTSSPPWAKKKSGSCGIPIAGTLCGIVDENLNFLPIGESGELVVAGPQIMLGYHNRPEENKLVFFEAGGYRWLRTGDYAKMDEEGYIFLIDRVKDMIKYKGHSVYPREIEEILYEHPAIQECAVIGIKDPERGENIMVHIIPKEDYKGKITEQEIIDWSKQNMAAYKYPRIVKFVEELPKSAVGKILRRIIREQESKNV